MEIRVLSDQVEEVRQVATWVYHEWGQVNPYNSVKKMMEVFSARSGSRSIPLTLIAIEKEIVGTVSLVENEYKSLPDLTPFLSSLYVPPKHRQKGVAEVLCKQILKEAKELGFDKCYLVTDNKKDFYWKRGWKIITEYVHRDAPSFLMGITL